mmetsp:Transcript_3856/g.9179  ORF Transcript_3856/g.9179 Transcript_3856/m.9179 type:complete len:389 (+) Transcript_3856:225-1391(+)
MGRPQQPRGGLLLSDRERGRHQRGGLHGPDRAALVRRAGVARRCGDSAPRQRRRGEAGQQGVHGMPRRLAVRPDLVPLPPRPPLERRLREGRRRRPHAPPLGCVQGLWRHHPASHIHGREHRPEGQGRVHPSALGGHRGQRRSRHAAAPGGRRRAPRPPRRHGFNPGRARNREGPPLPRDAPQGVARPGKQQRPVWEEGPPRLGCLDAAVPRDLGDHTWPSGNVRLWGHRCGGVAAHHGPRGALGSRLDRLRLPGSLLPLQDHHGRPWLPAQRELRQEQARQRERQWGGPRPQCPLQHLRRPCTPRRELAAALRDLQDREAAPRQALRHERQVRGVVRPLLPLGRQLHRQGQPTLLLHLPPARDLCDLGLGSLRHNPCAHVRGEARPA